MKQVIVRVYRETKGRNDKLIRKEYFYSQADYYERVVKFVGEIEPDEYVEITAGRDNYKMIDYEYLQELKEEVKGMYSIDGMEYYFALVDNYTVRYLVNNYLPQY